MKPPEQIFEYDEPFSERYESFVEPLIKPICDKINKSGWVWTSESCEGHTGDNPSTNWGDEKSLLRLVVHRDNAGKLIELFINLIYNVGIKHDVYFCKTREHWISILFYFKAYGLVEDATKHQRNFLNELANRISEGVEK